MKDETEHKRYRKDKMKNEDIFFCLWLMGLLLWAIFLITGKGSLALVTIGTAFGFIIASLIVQINIKENKQSEVQKR